MMHLWFTQHPDQDAVTASGRKRHSWCASILLAGLVFALACEAPVWAQWQSGDRRPLPAGPVIQHPAARITWIEERLYGRQYPDRPLSQRLAQVEKTLYGQPQHKKATESQRLGRLWEAYLQHEVSHPDDGQLPILSYLEERLLAVRYEQQPIETRLARLETFLFGAVSSAPGGEGASIPVPVPSAQRLRTLLYQVPLYVKEIRLSGESGVSSTLPNDGKNPISQAAYSHPDVSDLSMEALSQTPIHEDDRVVTLQPSDEGDTSDVMVPGGATYRENLNQNTPTQHTISQNRHSLHANSPHAGPANASAAGAGVRLGSGAKSPATSADRLWSVLKQLSTAQNQPYAENRMAPTRQSVPPEDSAPILVTDSHPEDAFPAARQATPATLTHPLALTRSMRQLQIPAVRIRTAFSGFKDRLGRELGGTTTPILSASASPVESSIKKPSALSSSANIKASSSTVKSVLPVRYTTASLPSSAIAKARPAATHVQPPAASSVHSVLAPVFSAGSAPPPTVTANTPPRSEPIDSQAAPALPPPPAQLPHPHAILRKQNSPHTTALEHNLEPPPRIVSASLSATAAASTNESPATPVNASSTASHYLLQIPRTESQTLLRWDSLPVYVYVRAASATDTALVRDAIQRWQTAVPMQLVQYPAHAHIWIDWTQSPSRLDSPLTEPVLHLNHQKKLQTMVTIRLGDYQSAAPSTKMRAVMHQLGHALGLWTHSNEPNDLMYPADSRERRDIASHWQTTTRSASPPSITASTRHASTGSMVLLPSSRDLNTLQQLYAHPSGSSIGTYTPPTLRPKMQAIPSVWKP
ncbi:MAG: matrixin family metalloprotease [Candidatus Melainabacteria bacterium]|nr:matrixin family metalloprotease [Candidatus Melainabacteria bacterium]